MKKIIYILLLLLPLTWGCDDFLDVNPKSIVVNDDLFTSDEGFQDALYGIYSSLGDSKLYGKKLSVRFTELMAQNFLPSATGLEANALSRLEFEDSQATYNIKMVWGDMYEIIGYINNLLENLEKMSVSDLRYYNLYKGEALGLRAAIHFDLLRLYAVNYNSSDANAVERGIPYVTSYSHSITKFSSVEKVYEYIIRDFKEAEMLLEEDMELVTYPRMEGGLVFTDARITHLNLYAAQALLARVYWQMGDINNAYIYAKKIIDSEKFVFAEKTSIYKEFRSVMSFNETIWGVYSSDFCKETKNNFYVSGKLTPRSDYRDFYEVDEQYGKDYRISWFETDDNNNLFLCKFLNLEAVESSSSNGIYDDSRGYMGINMIRIPEMYLIVAEALLDKDNQKALEYFDAVIDARGMMRYSQRDPETILTKEMIMRERRIEFIGEGQEWFRMKRENEDIELITSGHIVTGCDAIYSWPYPDIEDEMNK